MLLASKVAKKNLIKNFLDADWFNDYSTGGGTMSVDPVNPHKMSFSIISAQGRLIWIPVETGKTYTFSFKSMNCLYRFYKRKVGNHDIAMNMVQDGNVGKPDTFTFTPDESYKGFVTLRLTHSQAGTYTVENLQLEVGNKTAFEPYTLVNPNASVPPVATKQVKKNLIPDLVSFPNTNDRTKLVYQNENRLLMNATALTDYVNIQFPAKKGQLYNFWATELNENARVAIREVKADGTKTFLTNLTQIYMSHSFTTSSSVDKIEIECTVKTIGQCIFDKIQLEEGSKTTFERYQSVNPVATLYPKKNFIPPYSAWRLPTEFTAISDYKVRGNFPAGYVIKEADVYIDLEVGKTYTISGLLTPVMGRIRVGTAENVLVGTIGVLGMDKLTFKATQKRYRVSIDNNMSGSSYSGVIDFENIQLEEGSTKTDFEAYQLTNLRSV